MRFLLVDQNGRCVEPPEASNAELRKLITELFADMENVYLSSDEMVRCLSMLDSLIGTTGLLVAGQPGGELSTIETANLQRRLLSLSEDANNRIESDPSIKDLVVQLRFLTAQAARRNLGLLLVTE